MSLIHAAVRQYINAYTAPAFGQLKPIYDKEDSIPEGLKDFYAEKDGKFVLDLDGTHPTDKDKISEFRDNNVQLMKEKKELEDKLSSLSGIDVENYRKMQKELENIKDKKLIDAGKLDQVLEQRTERMRKDFDSQTNALTGRAETAEKKLKDANDRLRVLLIDTELTNAVTAVGTVRAGAMQDVLSRGRSVWSLADDGTPVALNVDGSTKYGKDGRTPMTMEEFAQELVTEASYLFEGSSGGGGRGNERNNRNADGHRVIDREDQRAFNRNLEDIAKGKVVVRTG